MGEWDFEGGCGVSLFSSSSSLSDVNRVGYRVGEGELRGDFGGGLGKFERDEGRVAGSLRPWLIDCYLNAGTLTPELTGFCCRSEGETLVPQHHLP